MEKIQFYPLPTYADEYPKVYDSLKANTLFQTECDPIALGIGIVPDTLVKDVVTQAPLIWAIVNGFNVVLLKKDPDYARLAGLKRSDIAHLSSSGRFDAQEKGTLMFEGDSLDGITHVTFNEINATPWVVGYAHAILAAILGNAPSKWRKGTKDLDLVMRDFFLDKMPVGKNTLVILEGTSPYEQTSYVSHEDFAARFEDYSQGDYKVLILKTDTLADLDQSTLSNIGVVYNTIVDGGLSLQVSQFIGDLLQKGVSVIHSYPAASIRAAAYLVHSNKYQAALEEYIQSVGLEVEGLGRIKPLFVPLDLFFQGCADTQEGALTNSDQIKVYLEQRDYIQTHWFKFTISGMPKLPESLGTHLFNGASLSSEEKDALTLILSGDISSAAETRGNGKALQHLTTIATYLAAHPDAVWTCVAQKSINHHKLEGVVPILTSEGQLSLHLIDPLGMLRFYMWEIGGKTEYGFELFIGGKPPIKSTQEAAAPAKLLSSQL